MGYALILLFGYGVSCSGSLRFQKGLHEFVAHNILELFQVQLALEVTLHREELDSLHSDKHTFLSSSTSYLMF